jgi:hypothetical protein
VTLKQTPILNLKFPEVPVASQVVNREELLAALQDVGRTLGMRVRPYSATAHAPFASFLAVMAGSAVVVSRHGPLLANSIFLPPGPCYERSTSIAPLTA